MRRVSSGLRESTQMGRSGSIWRSSVTMASRMASDCDEAEKAGVKYYNDSKGTNPDAAIQAVNAMPGPTILIAGGYDKNSEYDEWIRSFGKKVRYMVLLGQTREKIAECAARHGFTNVMYAEDMQEAVRVCASYANAGEYVLLSPACASWGMFKDYEERGDIFKECVRNL